MNFLRENLLTILIFLPTAGAILVLLQRDRDAIRWTALAFSVLTFALSLALFLPGMFDWTTGSAYGYLSENGGNVQLVQQADWIPAFNIRYKVGIDWLSFPLVLLSTFICALSCLASWNIEKMA